MKIYGKKGWEKVSEKLLKLRINENWNKTFEI